MFNSYEKEDIIKNCLALSHGKHGVIQGTPLARIDSNCFDGRNCFIASKKEKKLKCDGSGELIDSTESTVSTKMNSSLFGFTEEGKFIAVVCKTSDQYSYFPKSFHWHEVGLCAFEQQIAVNNLKGAYIDILEIISMNKIN